jgi:hypothetical protein
MSAGRRDSCAAPPGRTRRTTLPSGRRRHCGQERATGTKKPDSSTKRIGKTSAALADSDATMGTTASFLVQAVPYAAHSTWLAGSAFGRVRR